MMSGQNFSTGSVTFPRVLSYLNLKPARDQVKARPGKDFAPNNRGECRPIL